MALDAEQVETLRRKVRDAYEDKMREFFERVDHIGYLVNATNEELLVAVNRLDPEIGEEYSEWIEDTV